MGSHQASLWSLWIPWPTAIPILAGWTPFLIPCGCLLSLSLGWCLHTSYTMLALSSIVCSLRWLSWYYHPWSAMCSILNSIQTKNFPDLHCLLLWILVTGWHSPLLSSWSFVALFFSVPTFHTRHPLSKSWSQQWNHLLAYWGLTQVQKNYSAKQIL